MHLSSSRLTLAATDLGRFLACRHLIGLDVEVDSPALQDDFNGGRQVPPIFRVAFRLPLKRA